MTLPPPQPTRQPGEWLNLPRGSWKKWGPQFFWARHVGRDLATARTMVVDLVVACGVAHLFNVRVRHGGSLTWRGGLGTPAVIGAVGIVALAQALFTYAPVMQRLFDSRALSVAEAAIILGLAAAVMVLLEGEKLLVRRLGWG